MKKAFLILIIAIFLFVFSYFISVKFYPPLVLPVAGFSVLAAYVFFGGKGNEDRLKNSLLISALIYIISTLIWPKYIAVRPPGLPLIGIQRLANLLALSMFVLAMFSSNWFKKEIANSFNKAKVFWIFFGGLVFFRFASVFISRDIPFSLFMFMSDFFVHWFFIFTGVFIGSSHRYFIIFLKAIVFCFFVNFLIAITELALGKNLFLPFLNTIDPALEWVLKEKSRDGLYRVQSVFLHPITFAEFASVGFCFTVCMLSHIKNKLWRAISIFLAVSCASIMVLLSGSRSGYVATAVIISLVVFSPLANSLLRKQMNLKTTALWSFLIIALTIAVGLLGILVYDYTFGKYISAATVGSSTARLLMLEQTFVKLIESPIVGHGVGLGAELVGLETGNPYAPYTIDSLFISYTVESGIFALISFIALIAIGASTAFRTSFYGKEEYWFMSYMIGLSIIAFALFKIILSLVDNNFLLFIILGISVSRITQNSIEQKNSRGVRYAL
jgi:O-antigen ligase